MIKKSFFAILAVLTFVSTASGNVVATLPWIGSIVREIGRDKVVVTVLVKPNQDPHFAEAKPSMIVAASKADIIMYNGLDLEVGYLPLIVASSRNQRIQPGQKGNLDCSRYVNAIERPNADIDRGMGDVHSMGNPHYHLSPENILRVAEGITDVLSDSDAPNAQFYKANLKTFKERLMEKQKQWGASLKGKRFIAFHKYFEYLAHEFGFQIEAYVESKPGITPSSGHIGRLIESIARTKPDGILTTAFYGKKEVEFLSLKTGVKAIVVPHEVGCLDGINDWFTLMDRIVESLR
ncbi:MAG: metal ABC transporter substrate-binding protein [Deltaproteobacteria bacterium]